MWLHASASAPLSESTFTNLNVDCGQVTNSVPLTIESAGASLESMRFIACDFQHPGAGKNLVVIDGHGHGSMNSFTFIGGHFEGSNTDTTTPFISVRDVINVGFYTPFGNSLDAGSTNYLVTISQSASNQTDGIVIVDANCPNGNCVNDTINTLTYAGNSVMNFYSFTRSGSTSRPAVFSGSTVIGGQPTTVAGLPTCNSTQSDAWRIVTDATAPTYNATLTGGGAVRVPVYCNGANWTSH
jgi:hypothetical protein